MGYSHQREANTGEERLNSRPRCHRKAGQQCGHSKLLGSRAGAEAGNAGHREGGRPTPQRARQQGDGLALKSS